MISWGWPDIIIIMSCMISAHRGWKLGFLTELAGTIAVAGAIVAAFLYRGSLDRSVVYASHVWIDLNPESAHIIGMFLFALIAYSLISLFAILLNRYSTWPYMNPINATGGAILGILKALFFYWVLLYITLFLPLSKHLRADLHSSFLVMTLTHQSRVFDSRIRSVTPLIARPFIRAHNL